MNGLLGANKCTSIRRRSCGLADTAGSDRFTIIEKIMFFFFFFFKWMESQIEPGLLVCPHTFVQTQEEINTKQLHSIDNFSRTKGKALLPLKSQKNIGSHKLLNMCCSVVQNALESLQHYDKSRIKSELNS